PAIHTLSLHDALPICIPFPWRSSSCARITSAQPKKRCEEVWPGVPALENSFGAWESFLSWKGKRRKQHRTSSAPLISYPNGPVRSEEHTSELQSQSNL